MKQNFRLTVTVPASNCHLEIQGVYQIDNKLIAITKLTTAKGFGAASLTERSIAVEIEVNGSRKLPIESYVIAEGHCGIPDSTKRISSNDAAEMVKGLTPLNVRTLDVNESNSIITRAQELTGLNRNTLFAVSAISVATAVAGLTLLAQMN